MSETKRATRIAIRCCAFCGHTEFQVSLLIQGPAIGFESKINICRDCVKICSDVIEEHDKAVGSVPVVEGEASSSTHRSEAP